jgi:hypothetical protein
MATLFKNVDGVQVELTAEELSEQKQQHDYYDQHIAPTVGREKRNSLLEATDWWAVGDLIMTEEQRSYRQALRDITAHDKWPLLMPEDWPTKPE